jgi:hypothetical protein
VTRDEANQLLDAVRAGHDANPGDIREALIASGDLAPPQPRSIAGLGRPAGWQPGVRVKLAERREHESFVRLAATVCAPLTVGDLGISGG